MGKGGGGGGKKFVRHCHSVMHEYETIQIFKFSEGGGDSRAHTLCMSCILQQKL